MTQEDRTALQCSGGSSRSYQEPTCFAIRQVQQLEA
jgi:hypothetical protein